MRILLTFCFLLTAIFCSGQQTDDTTTHPNSSENLEVKTTEQLEKIKDELSLKGKAKEMLVVLLVLEKRIREENGIENKKYIESLSELSFTYEGLGDYKNAEIYYLKTLDAAKNVLGEQSSTYILNLCYFGDFMKNKGNYEKAEYYLLKAFEAGKDKRADFDDIGDYAGLYGFLANYYRSIVDYSKALPLYLEELTIFESENSEGHQEYAATLSNLADVYTKLTQFEKALFYSKKSVKLTEKHFGKDNFGYGQRVNNLAIQHANLGDHLKADSLYKISIENAVSLFGKEHHEYAFRLCNAGINNRNLKKYSKAEQEIGEALAILQNILPDSHKIIKDVKSKHASALFYTGERELAANQLIEALSLNVKGEEDFKLGERLRLNWILETEGFEEIAERSYLGCNEESLKNIKNTFEYLSENEQFNFSRFFQMSNNLLESYAFRNKDKTNLREACLNNEILWKGLLLENKKRLRKAIESNSNEDLKLKYLEWQELKKSLAEVYKLPVSKRPEDFKNLVYKEEDLEGLLSRESISFKKAQKRVNWQDLSSSLKEDELILEFSDIPYFNSASPDRADSVFHVVYLIKKGLTTPVFIPLFETRDLLKLNKTLSLYKFDKEANNNLHSTIWEKIEPEMEGIQTIYYSPSGLLNKINFSTIPISQTETIGDKFVLHNMGSTRQLVFPDKKITYQITDAIIYGGIDYQSDTTSFVKIEQTEKEEKLATRNLGDKYRGLRGNDWDFLEWTNKEADNIATTLEKNKAEVTLFKAKEATEESFKNIGVNSPSPRILHLATHGYFFPDPKKDAKTGFRASEHPLIRSGLILAGANHAWKGGTTPTDKEDGILTAYEIAQMDLSNTELVVLSACNTGLGDIEGNEGVYGLQRAFKMAGAKYILMSLWSVDDRKTYEFMTRFYELSQTEGKSIPEAYQLTQNEMRKKYALPFNPQAWAGFVLVQ